MLTWSKFNLIKKNKIIMFKFYFFKKKYYMLLSKKVTMLWGILCQCH